MLFLSVASVYLVYMTNNAKTIVARSINQEGVFALNQMEFILRGASIAKCGYKGGTVNANAITLTGVDNQTYIIAIENPITITKGASAGGSTTALTSTEFEAKACGNPGSTHSFECTSVNGKDFVKVCFELKKAGLNISQPFETQIQLRN